MAGFDFTALGNHLESELVRYDRRFYRVPEKEYWATDSSVIPSVPDMPLGLKSVKTFEAQTVGEAGVWDGKSNDIRLMSHVVRSGEYYTVVFIDGAEWSMMDVEEHNLARSSSQGVPMTDLVGTHVENTRTGLLRATQKAVLAGLPNTKFEGFFNSSKLDVIDETAETPLLMTPPQLEEWVRSFISPFKKTNNLSYDSLILWVSDNLWLRLTKSISDTNQATVKQLLTDPNRGVVVRDIRPITELDNDQLIQLGIYGAGVERERIIMGDFTSANKITRHYYPINRTQPFVKTNTGVHFGITAWSGTSEVIFTQPDSFAYVEYNSDMTP